MDQKLSVQRDHFPQHAFAFYYRYFFLFQLASPFQPYPLLHLYHELF